jgi:crotonobetainyl-CoA:carnitine CoA-transferase CaiB-like acyl-CoA transferase
LGQHTDEVLAEWLGMSAREIEAYHKENPVKSNR